LHAGRRVAMTAGARLRAGRRLVPQRLAVEHRQHAGIGAVVLLHRLGLAAHEGGAGAAVGQRDLGGGDARGYKTNSREKSAWKPTQSRHAPRKRSVGWAKARSAVPTAVFDDGGHAPSALSPPYIAHFR